MRGSVIAARRSSPRFTASFQNAAWRSGPNGWPFGKAVLAQGLADVQRDFVLHGDSSLDRMHSSPEPRNAGIRLDWRRASALVSRDQATEAYRDETSESPLHHVRPAQPQGGGLLRQSARADAGTRPPRGCRHVVRERVYRLSHLRPGAGGACHGQAGPRDALLGQRLAVRRAGAELGAQAQVQGHACRVDRQAALPQRAPTTPASIGSTFPCMS